LAIDFACQAPNTSYKDTICGRFYAEAGKFYPPAIVDYCRFFISWSANYLPARLKPGNSPVLLSFANQVGAKRLARIVRRDETAPLIPVIRNEVWRRPMSGDSPQASPAAGCFAHGVWSYAPFYLSLNVACKMSCSTGGEDSGQLG
jgi:hypothetical protein